MKHALVTPLLKETGLIANYIKNYRPILNLSFVLKLLERHVAIVRVCYEYNIYASQVICVQDGNCPFITQLPPGRPGVAIRQNDNSIGGIR